MKTRPMPDHKTLSLAKAAGFIFWEGETWGPGVWAVDWSCDYDSELEEFKRMVVRECAYVVQTLVDQGVPASEYRDRLMRHWKM